MKRKIIAMATVLMVGIGAGVYAVSGSAASRGLTAAPRQAVTAASASFQGNTASAEESLRNFLSQAAAKAQCPTQSAVSAGAQSDAKAKTASSAAAASQAAKSGSCAGSSCAARQACASNSCTDGSSCLYQTCTGAKNCGSVVVANGSRLTYQQLAALLNKLKSGSSCSKTVSSKPSTSTSSKPATSSRPAASSQTPSSSQASSGSGTYASFQNEVVRLVNAERAKNGLKALSVSAALTKTATLKSQDMATKNYFSHTSPTYGSPFDMMRQFGISYRTAGENIAWGQTSPAQVMNGWMNSPGHRANILNASFTQIGVGVAQNSDGRYYWTQQFIG